jgi:hypothetical protein
MLKKIKLSFIALFAVAGLSGSFAAVIIPASTAGAAACPNTKIITIPAWYKGLQCSADGGVEAPARDANGDNMKKFVWQIGLNVAEIILQIIGYIAIFFMIYGGFLYLTSNGAPDRASSGLRTIINASIGLAIGMSTIAIKNFIWQIVASGTNAYGVPNDNATTILSTGLNAVYFVTGAVAVIMLIIGGLNYITASGDPGKMTKAKNTILYAVVGLVIVIAASAITNFVVGRF